MEHIRQSSQKHASGTFDVAEDITGLRPTVYLGPVFVLPLPYKLEKLIPVCLGANPGHAEEDIPELSCIGGFGDITTPDQPLPLDVDQATLHGNTGPEAPEHVRQVRVAINSETNGAQAPLYQAFQKNPKLRFRALGDSILANDKRMGLRIHQRNKAARAMDKRPVQYEVLALPQARDRLCRCLCQISVDHAVQLPRAVPALIDQLPNRVAFDDPTPEPFLFVGLSGPGIAPTKRAPAPGTEPPLLTVGIMPVSFDNIGTTRAVFF